MPKKPVVKKKAEKDPTNAEVWLQRISRAKKVKEKWKEAFRIALGYEYWEGRQRPPDIPDKDWITINLIYSNMISMLPTLYSTDPYFYVKLKRSYKTDPMMIALYEVRSKIRQSMLNYLKEELELKTKTRLSIFDAMFQFGILKVHHEAEMVENPDAGKAIEDEDGNVMVGEDGQPLKEPNEIPASEAYKITRIHPDDFLVDEDAGPLNEDISWCAQRIKRRLSDAKKDRRFKASARDKLKATEISDQAQKERESRKKGGIVFDNDKIEPDTVVLWELYDHHDGKWMVLAEDLDQFLIDPEEIPEGIETDPFVTLRFTLRDDSWFPMPPVSQWIDPQKEYCSLRSKLVSHRKRFNRKYTAVRGWLSEDEARKIEQGDDGTIAWQEQPGTPAVFPIADAPLDQTHVQELAMLRDELTLVSIGPNQRASGRGVESATEASVIEKRLQVQEGDWIGLIVDFVRDVARKIDQLVQANLTEDQAIRVVGPQGEFWQLVRSEDYQAIEGEYEYSVNVGATTPQLPEIERSQWLAFLNLIASAPQLAMSKRLLKHQADLHHIDDEVLIDELFNLAQMMMSGGMPMPGTQGSVPGQPGLPGTASAGMAAGSANFRGGQ